MKKDMIISYLKRNGVLNEYIINNYIIFLEKNESKLNDKNVILNFKVENEQIILECKSEIIDKFKFKSNGVFYWSELNAGYLPILESEYDKLSFDKYEKVYKEKEIQKLKSIMKFEERFNEELLVELVNLAILEEDTESPAALYFGAVYEIELKSLTNCLDFITFVKLDLLQLWDYESQIEGRFYINDQDYDLTFYDDYTIIIENIFNKNDEEIKVECHRWKICKKEYENIVNIEDYLKNAVEF